MQKFWKRALAVLLAVMMIGSASPVVPLPLHASAASYSGECGAEGDNVTWTLDTETGTLTISGTGEMADYGEYVAPWYSDRESIETVTIESGVTSIGDSAFEACMSLTGITIPDSVTSIGRYAFVGCTSMTSIRIGSSVTTIENDAFYGCRGLTSVTIPDGVTSIGDEAFYWCTSLTSITIPDGVTSIGNLAFYDCESLTSVTIPDSVTHIGNHAFLNSTNLTAITVDERNPAYSSDASGVLFDKTKTTLIQYPAGNPQTAYTIPDSVTSIGHSAFKGCDSLTSVTILDSVTSIGGWAFATCRSLTSITIPDSVTNIGDDAFYGVGNVIYSGTANGAPWGAYALNGYDDGTLIYDSAKKKTLIYCRRDADGEVVIPDSVTSIGNCAFESCTSLTGVSIPDSVTSIGNGTFEGCMNLTSITIPDSVTSIGGSAFSDCKGLTSVTIPDGVTSIGGSAFSDCKGLTSVTIGNSVTSIGHSAFSMCTSLTSVMIPDSVTSIRGYAFSDCTSLTSVTIGNSVTSIEWRAFGNCEQLQKVCYNGTPESWAQIDIGDDNDSLQNAARYYHSHDPANAERIGAVAATCTEPGFTGDLVFSCGLVLEAGETISALGHNWIAATCTEAKTCSRCKITEGGALGHSFGAWRQTKAPTEYEFGERQRECSVCHVVEKERIEKLPATVLTLNKTSVTLQHKKTDMLTASEPVTWTSSNEKVVKVDANGKLTTVKRGTAVITAHSVQGGKTATCTVTVKYAWWQWLIIIFLFGWLWY